MRGGQLERLRRTLGSSPFEAEEEFGESFKYESRGHSSLGIAGFVFPTGEVTRSPQPHILQHEALQEILGNQSYTDLGILRWRWLRGELNIEAPEGLTREQEELIRRFFRKHPVETTYVDVTLGDEVLRSETFWEPTADEVIRFIKKKGY